tara:strand:+ start:1397 stop:1612 length:216 start_codon:yes stop_codon:yes gene_type:complete
MKKRWSNKSIKKIKILCKTKTAREIGIIFNKSKNSILGILYRDKVEKGYKPPLNSKFAIKKPNYPSHLFNK